MSEKIIANVFPVQESEVLNEFILKSGEPAILVENGKQRELVKTWLEKGIDLHLSTIVCIDEMEHLELMYYFMDRSSFNRIAVYVKLDRENPVTPSIHDLIGSTLYEGEITEMFGVHFEGNKLTQVFLPENWEFGFPLRKDWVDKRKLVKEDST